MWARPSKLYHSLCGLGLTFQRVQAVLRQCY